MVEKSLLRNNNCWVNNLPETFRCVISHEFLIPLENIFTHFQLEEDMLSSFTCFSIFSGLSWDVRWAPTILLPWIFITFTDSVSPIKNLKINCISPVGQYRIFPSYSHRICEGLFYISKSVSFRRVSILLKYVYFIHRKLFYMRMRCLPSKIWAVNEKNRKFRT